jgi:hypothetical protein
MPEVIPSNPTLTPGTPPNLAGAGSLLPGDPAEVQPAPGVPTPGTVTPVTPETPGMFPGAAPDVHPSTPGLFPGTPPSTTPEAPPAPENPEAFALKTRRVDAGGLAIGGGDLTVDRTITVPVASQAQAVAGSANNVAMTPLRTAQHVAAWWTAVTTAVKTTGNQVISGVKTFATSPRSTGTPDADTSLMTRRQVDLRRLRAIRREDRWLLRERLEYFSRGTTVSGDIGEWGWTSTIGAGGSLSYGGTGAFATGRAVQLSTGSTINTTVEVRKAIGTTMERASILSMFLEMAPVVGGSTSPITDAAVWFGWDDGAFSRRVMAGWDTLESANFQIKVRGSYDSEETVIDTGVPLASMVPPYWPASIVLDVIGSYINNEVLGDAEAHRISLCSSVDWIGILERYTTTVPASQIDGTNIFCRVTNRAATNKVIRLTGVEVLHGSGNPSGQH